MSETTIPANLIAPIVRVRDGVVYASSLDVAAFFGKRHDHVVRDVRKILVDQPDFSLPNFGEQEYVSEKNQKQPCFDMTRDGFTLLVMGFTGKKAAEFKIRYIQEFGRMEAALRERPPAFALPRTMAEALRLAADQAEQIEQQKISLEQRQAVIERQEPVVLAFERIAEADGSLCITDAAKTIGLRRDDLSAKMQADRMIYRRQGSDWIAYQGFIERGWLIHKTRTHARTDGSETVSSQVRVTSKGLAELAKRYTTQRPLNLSA
jgi:anti-repressor protein